MVKVGGNASLYADTEAGVILFVSNEMYWSRNRFASIKQCSRPFYRLSFDDGVTWTDKIYIITEGQTFDHPIPGVVFGRNFCLSMASQTMRADDGSLLVALQMQMVDEEGTLIEPGGFHFFQCGALRAKWNEAALRYDWTMGDTVGVLPELSMRGLFEPTFAKVGENRVIMVMRNSNMKAPQVIGQKFYALSEDNGLHWSEPVPLTYDDGSTMYSSSCVPKLLSHSNGKLYYIGVILTENPDGNLPRHPLCIAELDCETYTVRRDTVQVVEAAREHHGDAPPKMRADYTNHGVYEDTRGRIIIMPPYRKDNTRGLNRCVVDI